MKLINKDDVIKRIEKEFDGTCISGCTANSLEQDFEDIVSDTPVVIDTKDDDFTILVVSAIRYAIGRRTYVPYNLTSYITPLLPSVSDKLLFLLERDIREQGNYGEEAYGDPRIDKPVWMVFYNEINKEVDTRKQKGIWSYEESVR